MLAWAPLKVKPLTETVLFVPTFLLLKVAALDSGLLHEGNRATLLGVGASLARWRAVTSGDGNDTINGFTDAGNDILQFNFSAAVNWADGLADPLAYLQAFFTVAQVDTDGVAGGDSTKISVGDWSTTLVGHLYGDANADGFSDVFDHVDIYVNDVLIG